MSLTFAQANDDMLSIFREAWLQTNFKIFYEDIPEDRSASSDPFCRVFVRHTSGGQRTLGKLSRMFSRNGFIRAEIYTPIANGLQESYRLAKVVADAYEGKSSDNGVWFRRVRIMEMGKDGMFKRIDVIIDFEYHETK